MHFISHIKEEALIISRVDSCFICSNSWQTCALKILMLLRCTFKSRWFKSLKKITENFLNIRNNSFKFYNLQKTTVLENIFRIMFKKRSIFYLFLYCTQDLGKTARRSFETFWLYEPLLIAAFKKTVCHLGYEYFMAWCR